jgi:polyhydroxyalkanoate synthesis regulator phasin
MTDKLKQFLVCGFSPHLAASILLLLATAPLPESMTWLSGYSSVLVLPAFIAAWFMSDTLLTGRREGRQLLSLSWCASLVRLGRFLVYAPQQEEENPEPEYIVPLVLVGLTLLCFFGCCLGLGAFLSDLAWPLPSLVILFLDLLVLTVCIIARGAYGTFSEHIWPGLQAEREKRQQQTEAVRTAREELVLCHTEHAPHLGDRLPRSQLDAFMHTFMHNSRAPEEARKAGQEMRRRIEKLAGTGAAKETVRKRMAELGAEIDRLDSQIHRQEEELERLRKSGANPHLLERELGAQRRRQQECSLELRKLRDDNPTITL